MKQRACAYQGIEGSFSHIAAARFLASFGEGLSADDAILTRQFSEIFSAVCDGRARFGLVPIENSLAGSIHENFDLLMRFPVWVCGELYLRVEHQLLCLPEVNAADELTRVFSHPQALGQCRLFFEEHQKIEEIVYSDTARAALHVAEQKQRGWGAIASKDAGLRYGLKVLEANIEDDPDNYTRFLVICSDQERETISAGIHSKASLALTLAHRPGSLAGLLERLASANCNLTKIESRPIHGRPFEYRFYLDLEFAEQRDEKDVALITQEYARELRILGIYPRDRIPEIPGA